MPIVFPCKCGKWYSINDAYSGRLGRCETCKTEMNVPKKSVPFPSFDDDEDEDSDDESDNAGSVATQKTSKRKSLLKPNLNKTSKRIDDDFENENDDDDDKEDSAQLDDDDDYGNWQKDSRYSKKYGGHKKSSPLKYLISIAFSIASMCVGFGLVYYFTANKNNKQNDVNVFENQPDEPVVANNQKETEQKEIKPDESKTKANPDSETKNSQAPVVGRKPTEKTEGKPTVDPEGFYVVNKESELTGEEKPAASGENARMRLLRQMADSPPVFDTAQVPKTPSTTAYLLSRTNLDFESIQIAELKLKGVAIPRNDRGRKIEQLLRGQMAPFGVVSTNQTKENWKPIKPDEPTPAFNIKLETGIPLERGVMGKRDAFLLNGPIYVQSPWWINFWPRKEPYFEFDRDKRTNKLSVKKENIRPNHQVIDLRTAEVISEFDWKAPIWANARISLDGKTVVGPDSTAVLTQLANGQPTFIDADAKKTVYVWKKNEPKGLPIRIAGKVVWLDFLGNDRIAVLSITDKPNLQFFDIDTLNLIGETSFTGQSTGNVESPGKPTDDTPIYAGLEFYQPSLCRGAVSSTGKYLAIGMSDGVHLIDTASRLRVGLLPIEKLTHYRSIKFSPDGTTVSALCKVDPNDVKIYTWSVVNGGLVDIGTANDSASGSLLHTNVDGLFVSDRFLYFSKSQIEEMEPFGQRIISLYDDGSALVVGERENAPKDTPMTKSIAEQLQAKVIDDERAKLRDKQPILYKTMLDWNVRIEKAGALLQVISGRPSVKKVDRATVKPQSTLPPNDWKTPVFSQANNMADVRTYTTLPSAICESKYAVVRYVPKSMNRYRWQVELQMFNRKDNQLEGKQVVLWEYAVTTTQGTTSEEEVKDQSIIGEQPLPAICTLNIDGSQIALVDPNDPRRVDIFNTADGKRVTGFSPYGEKRIDWLGWASTGLLTIGQNQLTCWNIADAKAIYETDGNFTFAAAMSNDRKWLTAWCGTHADIIDSATGLSQGRLQTGGIKGTLYSFNLSPNNKRLAISYLGWPVLPAGESKQNNPQPGITLALWDLESGKCSIFGTTQINNSHPSTAWLTKDHLLFSGSGGDPSKQAKYQIIDAQLNRVVSVLDASQNSLGYPIVNSLEGIPCRVSKKTDFPANTEWKSVQWGELKNTTSVINQSNRKYFTYDEQPIQIKAKFGSPEDSQKLARKMAAMFSANGFKVGPGGTVYQIEIITKDTNTNSLHVSWRNSKGEEIMPIWEEKLEFTSDDINDKLKRIMSFDFAGKLPNAAKLIAKDQELQLPIQGKLE